MKHICIPTPKGGPRNYSQGWQTENIDNMLEESHVDVEDESQSHESHKGSWRGSLGGSAQLGKSTGDCGLILRASEGGQDCSFEKKNCNSS